ncbi:hypothetical protein ABT154_32270 [Streptomyces sp. NPDC001728]|uniref:hypothetical protein n=1 Tax=Streptomyces sp. NPDC001728 TaxID=3154396 RepID=UPI003319ADD1
MKRLTALGSVAIVSEWTEPRALSYCSGAASDRVVEGTLVEVVEVHSLHGELAAREGVGADAPLRFFGATPGGGAGAVGLADLVVCLVEEVRAVDDLIALRDAAGGDGEAGQLLYLGQECDDPGLFPGLGGADDREVRLRLRLLGGDAAP